MKRIYTLLIILFTATQIQAQIGIGTTTPDASAALDITNSTKGVLIPRMTEAERDAISTPATGLLIYQTDNSPNFYHYNGFGWIPFGGGGSGWDILGNSGTNPGANMLGTTDAQDLVIATNNTEAFRITADGNIGIKTTTPTALLSIADDSSAYSAFQDFQSIASGIVSTNTTLNIYQIDNNNVTCTNPNLWEIQETESLPTNSFECDGCIGNRAVINMNNNFTHQKDATLVVVLGAINYSTINLDFDFGYNHRSTDQFTVSLYNETNTSTEATLLGPLTLGDEGSFSQIINIANPGDNYSIRFRFEARQNYGLSIDNIQIKAGIPTPLIRIQDGNETDGYILYSDAIGNATWTDPATLTGTDEDWNFISGSTNADPMYHDGKVVIGSAGINTFVNLQLDIDNRRATGTEIGIGSDEYLLDIESETRISHNFSPLTDTNLGMGYSSRKWLEVYAVNGTINTSDIRDKTDIAPLKYGLDALLKLRPVSYKWKKEQYGRTVLTEDEKTVKIGFIAQELQKVLPEVVQTHEWDMASEETPNTYVKNKTASLGVSYSEIIPVVIKATQEHQRIIEEIKVQNKEIERLIKRLNK